MVPNLEKLILKGCTKLSEIHPSITLLGKLTLLNLKSCISLETLPRRIKAFCVDCFELVRKQGSKTTAFSSLKRFLQDPFDRSLVFEIVLSGSEIPAWFKEQSSGPSINIKLNPNWCSNKWIGLALSVCFRVVSDGHIYCKVESRNWRSRMARSIANVESLENHLWLFYLPRVSFPEDWNSCSNLEFSFYAKSTNSNSHCGPCGVRLVDEKDRERFNQIGSNENSDEVDVCSSTSKRVENMIMITPTISNGLISGDHVKILDLSNSNLSDEAFPDFGKFVLLEELNLSKNPFSALPSSISRLSKLRIVKD